jgi:cobalamin synthase
LFAGLRRLMCQRLGGTTCDVAGALAEAAVLLLLALTL